MSTAHRPTWDPAQARDTKGGSRQYSTRDMASQTKLKFRQPGQGSVAEVKRRDLRAELIAAEAEARDKKRKAEGKPMLDVEVAKLAITAGTNDASSVDEESNKRRKLLQEVVELDKDDESDEDAGDDGTPKKSNGGANGKRVDDDDEDEEDSDEDDDEDETAELLRELEKIKRERAEEKARQENEASAKSAEEREVEVAAGNPLLNLAAALGQAPQTASASVGGSFAVKKRWDDDLVFKNQAQAQTPQPTHFVNDLLRTEFHKKFMSKFIK